MIRLVCLLRRSSDSTLEAFRSHLLDVVGPLVAGLQAELGLARYVQFHADPDAAEGDRAAGELRSSPVSPFEAMADYWWPSEKRLEELCTSGQGLTAFGQIAQACHPVVDSAVSQCWLAVEFPQVSTGHARTVARPRTPLLKLAFPLMPLEGMSEASAQDYWLVEHGPFVRSHAVARGMACYQQVHRRESPLTSKLADALGMQSGNFMGHAEAWWDRSVPRGGPDVDQAKEKAALDERNFIDLQRSFLFSGKEYPFVDRDWTI